jgi:hypothetical protein
MRRERTAIAAVCVLALGVSTAIGAEQTSNSGGMTQGPGIDRNQPGSETPAARAAVLKLTDAQREQVRDAVLNEDTRQETPKGFKAAEGVVPPTKIHFHPLPRPLIYEIPALKEYMYATLDENVIIIEPLSKKTVAVIELPPQQARAPDAADKKNTTPLAGLPELKGDERQMVYNELKKTGAAAQPVPQPAAVAGSPIPAGVQFTPVPPELVARAPQLAGMQFALLQDGRVLLAKEQKVAAIVIDDSNTGQAGGEASGGHAASQTQGGADVEGGGQAAGAQTSESLPGGGTSGSGGVMQ